MCFIGFFSEHACMSRAKKYYKATLCYLASGSFFWRGFLLRGVGLQLFYFFPVFQKNKCAAMCVGCKNHDIKN
jgi:hypothetical protein